MEEDEDRRIKCSATGCQYEALKVGLCVTHHRYWVPPCSAPDCARVAVPGGINGRCKKHGGGARCLEPGCDKAAQSVRIKGRCTTHGGGLRCVTGISQLSFKLIILQARRWCAVFIAGLQKGSTKRGDQRALYHARRRSQVCNWNFTTFFQVNNITGVQTARIGLTRALATPSTTTTARRASRTFSRETRG